MPRPNSWHSLSEYNAFRAMMNAGTTVGAAQQLGVSQSAVSRSIGCLEERIGETLFERFSGRLRPTQEAERLNRRLDPLFAALDGIDGPEESAVETLRLAAPPSYAHRYLVSMIAGFLRANPRFKVNFEVGTSEILTEGVSEERFDLAISGSLQSRVGVRLTPFRSSAAVCVMHPDHVLAKREFLSPQDLHLQELIALTYRHGQRGRLGRLLHQCKASPIINAEVSTSFAAADLALEGMGIAVINPFPVYQYRSSELAFVPFVSPLRYKTYFLTSETRPLPRVARAFMRFIKLNLPEDPFTVPAHQPS